MPDNYTLIQRLTDDDIYVSRWLRQQTLSSSWVGRRLFYINDRDIDHGSYTYDFIRYRLDLGLGLPVRDDPEEALPVALLPKLKGRRHMRHFFQPHNMPRLIRRLGASKWIDHAAVPGNCAYFHDVDALPDVSLIANKRDGTEDTREITKLQSGSWEAGLADTWIDLIEDAQGERLVHYFTEVVCRRLALSTPFTSAQLIARLDPPGSGDTPAVLYDHFLDREYYSFEGSLPDPDAALRAGVVNAALSSGVAEAELLTREAERLKLTASGLSQWKAETTTLRQNIDKAKTRAIDELSKAISKKDRKDFFKKKDFSNNIADLSKFSTAAKTISETNFRGMADIKGLADGTIAALDSMNERFHDFEGQRERMIALYAALVNDLRRGWHAIRVHERSRDLGGANESRMPLYTLEKLKSDVFYKQQPIKTLLQSFSSASLREKKIQQLTEVFRPKPITIRDEKDDYEQWVRRMRQVGRMICDQWPIPPDDHPRVEGTIFDKIRWLEVLVEKEAEANKTNEMNSREARHFVWLLYGLVPSLPAIIHTELASEIYGCELRGYPGKDEIKEVISSKIMEWQEFIQELSIAFRYIKMKCLQLYAIIICEHLVPRNGKASEREERVKRLERFFSRGEVYRLELKPGDDDHREKVMEAIHMLFLKDKTKRAATDLAIMPDMAPSTLFGESWLADLVTDEDMTSLISDGPEVTRVKIPSTREEDSNQERKGIFGETEQWLWATDRCLEKFKAAADKLLPRD